MLTCYAQLEKEKSRRVLGAFAAGAGGRMAWTTAAALEPGPAAFYGVRPPWKRLWDAARREGREWWYVDNAYFDRARERYFRVTRNGLQVEPSHGLHSPYGAKRLRDLGVAVRDWRSSGSHVVVCPQSEEFLRTVAEYSGDWTADTVAALRSSTDREIRVRGKREPRPLAADLRGAWALVTHMSCAAVEALLAGIPVFVTGRCAAGLLGSSDLSRIESPLLAEGRLEWARYLAANQWTLEELRSGEAWRHLQAWEGSAQ